MTDEALVQAHQAGAAGAAGVLLARHRPSVERICQNRLRDREAAQDAVQETLLLCLKALGTFTGGELFSRYAKVVAVSVCRRSAHLERSTEVALDHEIAERLPAQGASLEQRCLDASLVQRILAELSPADAALIIRHHGQDRPLAELAAEQGASLTAVKVRLHRARQRARVIAQRQGALGLLPAPLLLPRLREALARLGGHRPEVIVGCALVAPALLVAVPLDDLDLRGPAAPPAVEVAVGAVSPPAPLSSARPTSRPGADSGRSPTSVVGRAPSSVSLTSPGVTDSSAFDVEPVSIPLVQRTVSRTPPRRAPDHSFEVADPAGRDALVGVDTYDEEGAGTACELAAQAPVLVTCRAGASAAARIGR